MPYSVCSTRCGHVWKYGELSSLCPPRDASLIQLNFSVHENLLAQRLEETGVWLDLESGEIQRFVQGQLGRLIKENMSDKGKLFIGAGVSEKFSGTTYTGFEA